MTNSKPQALIYRAEEANKSGNFDEAERLAYEVLAELDTLDGTLSEVETLRANAYLSLANTAMQRGTFDVALEQAEQVIALGEEYLLPTVQPKAWSTIGNVYASLGIYNRALEYYTKSLSAYEELGVKLGIAGVTGNIGIVYRNLGIYDKALEFMGKALSTHLELGEMSSAASATGNIGNVYLNLGIYDKALEYYSKALSTHEELGEQSGIAGVTGNIGLVYENLGMYDKALEYFSKSLSTNEAVGAKSFVASVMANIGNVYRNLDMYDKALEYYCKSLSAHEALGEQSGVAITTGNIGLVYQNLGMYDKALEYLFKSLSAHEVVGAKSFVAIVTGNIGNVYRNLGMYNKALEYMIKSLSTHEALGEQTSVAIVTGNIGALYATQKFEGYEAAKAEEYLLKAIALNEEIKAKRNLYENHKFLSDLYKHEERWKDFAIHFEKYHDIEKAVQSEEATKQAQFMEHRRKIEECERDRQVKLARFQEQEKILPNILPAKIAERIVLGEKTIADTHEYVSVFFSDIVGFTKLSQQVSAVELVGMLNGIFSQFDQIARKHGLEKIKTIGDSYMAVCGAPIQVNNHAERTALFALEVAEKMKDYRTNSGEKIEMRIGLHSGSVVAGIIGENKFAYDLWGDAVNTASRMESHSEAGKIHVSEDFRTTFISTTLNELPIQFIPRGEMDIKGKGMMKTYFLERIQ
ncbi:MAG: tetratricopeptide repeat protein [Bacteroidetes bacterium]|nr:tetratricopeptide repeat protein [Bacteroidota bacterium]